MQLLKRLASHEELNFLLTNRIPRVAATHCMGFISRIESRWFAALGIRVWQWFTELDLSEAKQDTFNSIRACFTRELKDGVRPIDATPHTHCSPCDAIVVGMGTIENGTVLQAKSFPYRIADLLGGDEAAQRQASTLEGGLYVTLRLTSAMYHRFHAPTALEVKHVRYINGDVWNVNPPALKRVPSLYCKNERAVMSCVDANAQQFFMIPVAAVLVSSMRLHCLNQTLSLRYRGEHQFDCDHAYNKGAELGWFEHGSTIVLLYPRGFSVNASIQLGQLVQMGQRLIHKQDETPVTLNS